MGWFWLGSPGAHFEGLPQGLRLGSGEASNNPGKFRERLAGRSVVRARKTLVGPRSAGLYCAPGMARFGVSKSAAFFSVALLASGGVLSSEALAQGGAGASATAESLFREGRDLMIEEKYPEACAKFEASYGLEPTLGTLLNLANCHELEGRTASAWAEFLRASATARAASQPEREQVARERAKALESRLMRLQIVVPEASRVAGLEVLRDQIAVETAAWGSAIPVDPGKHVVEAKAPGKQSATHEVLLTTEGVTVQLELPPLEDEAPEPVTPTPAASTASTPAAKPGSSPQPQSSPPPGDVRVDTDDGSTQRVLGIVVGSVGAAGLAAGSVFGALAKSKWDDAQGEGCRNGVCTTNAGQDASEDANRFATIGTIGLAGGGALLVTGVVLYLTAPSDGREQASSGDWGVDASVSPGEAAVSVRGSF